MRVTAGTRRRAPGQYRAQVRNGQIILIRLEDPGEEVDVTIEPDGEAPFVGRALVRNGRTVYIDCDPASSFQGDRSAIRDAVRDAVATELQRGRNRP